MSTILGQKIQFNNPEVLQLALTHRSAQKKNNERLEFLGDSILSFVITQWLFTNFPGVSEGKLSRMRSNLIKGTTLAEIARHYNLSDKLILGVGELKSGGFNRCSVLADAVEAIYGAVFVDQGIDVTAKFILEVMHNWLQKVDPNISDKDAKTRLQEYLQKHGLQVPSYSLVNKFGKDHLQTFKIKCLIAELKLSATAEERSRKKAEQQAAQNILNKITQLS
ncbi:Ribonuclease III [hydrothermal vent metagenome]|uniref:ribonuclease III n=1 Tax=hydrothermal vent metagenome TaxID=652676 RepID=A0A3B0UP35_9ZZZZ